MNAVELGYADDTRESSLVLFAGAHGSVVEDSFLIRPFAGSGDFGSCIHDRLLLIRARDNSVDA